MRKLRLLLYAGTMASALAGTAMAVEFPPSDGSTPTGPLQNPAGVGMVTNTSGFQENGSPYTAAQGQQYSPGTSSYGALPFSTPAPGTVIMRIDFQVVAAAMGAWYTGQNGQGFQGVPAEVGNKQNPYGIIGYMRIDLAADGMTHGGMRYGAFTEVRENSVGGQVAGTSAANASPTSSGTSADNAQNTLYARNICAYVGSDAAGIFKIGQGSCVDTGSAMLTGLNDEFDYGGWDGVAGTFTSAVAPTWPWPDSGADYMPQGVAYLSPVIAGFDVIGSFNPSNNTAITASACVANAGCSAQSSSNLPGDIGRWTNRAEIGLRYRGAFGPIGLAVSGTYAHSGQVQPGPEAPTTGIGAVRYNPLNFGIIGAEVSINKFFAIGANTMFGAFNGAGVMQAKPIADQSSATTAIAWEAGGKMSLPGLPMVFGASYYNFKFQGQPGLPTQRVSQGIDVGGSYGIGPGMVAFGEYLWGANRQGDYNFLTGACGAAAVCSNTSYANINNSTQVQIIMAGLAFKF
jgi:hypothetical protein